jgi:hypothetical protein
LHLVAGPGGGVEGDESGVEEVRGRGGFGVDCEEAKQGGRERETVSAKLRGKRWQGDARNVPVLAHNANANFLAPFSVNGTFNPSF